MKSEVVQSSLSEQNSIWMGTKELERKKVNQTSLFSICILKDFIYSKSKFRNQRGYEGKFFVTGLRHRIVGL